MIEEYIQKLKNKIGLSKDEASSCFAEILNKKLSDEKICEVLLALSEKGETYEEIAGFADELAKHKISVYGVNGAIDTCGTGGSGKDRFNIGTTVAFVLASGGYPVAKHGNRGSAQANGSFDLLEQLGVHFETNADQEAQLFQKHNLVFLYARTHHPVMKKLGPARAALARRTIINMIGPLCNPAHIDYQVVGVSSLKSGEKLIKAMKSLGRKRACVVYGEPGIDEFSISGESTYWMLKQDGSIDKHHFDPSVVGIQTRKFDAIPGGLSVENKELFFKVLNHDSCDGLLDMVCLNAGAAIFTMGKSLSIMDGFSTANELIESGRVREFFEIYKASSNKMRIS